MLERVYEHPDSDNLDYCINELRSALEQHGDRGTMIENLITSLTQARNAQVQFKQAGDVGSSAAFGQAFNALERAIETYSAVNNDPY